MDSEWTKYDERNIIDKTLAKREADKQKADAQADALAAEDTAVYNLDLIRKLERRITSLGFDNVAQAKHIELLTRLVVRMGEAVAILEWHSNNGQGLIGVSDVPYTPAGQRQRDAELHEAEGPPPDAGMLEEIQ